MTYFSDQIIDSKELDFAASLKYNWHKRWNDKKSSLKAGVQWKANGNVGEGCLFIVERVPDEYIFKSQTCCDFELGRCDRHGQMFLCVDRSHSRSAT